MTAMSKFVRVQSEGESDPDFLKLGEQLGLRCYFQRHFTTVELDGEKTRRVTTYGSYNDAQIAVLKSFGFEHEPE